MSTARSPSAPSDWGAGAGDSGDRIEPAVELAEFGDIDDRVFECLAERTIALAQQDRRSDAKAGFDPLREARMRAVLPLCHVKGIPIVPKMGAAHPLVAASKTAAIAGALGLQGLKIAAVTGDDVLDVVRAGDCTLAQSGVKAASLGARIVFANTYLGAGPICEALASGAQVVITGRIADPALFIAPLVHGFGGSFDDRRRGGQGTVVGHLLECAGQITGGHVADPGHEDVPNLARLGFPVGEADADGAVEIRKIAHAGGTVIASTCKELTICSHV